MRKISSALPDISVSVITTATSVMTLFLAQIIKKPENKETYQPPNKPSPPKKKYQNKTKK